MDLIETERRDPDKKRKLVAFLLVLGLMLAAELGKGTVFTDHISHAAVVAFMLTRIYMRNV